MTKKLSAEEVRERDDDMRRFLNSLNVNEVANAAINARLHRRDEVPERMWEAVADHDAAISARMPGVTL